MKYIQWLSVSEFRINGDKIVSKTPANWKTQEDVYCEQEHDIKNILKILRTIKKELKQPEEPIIKNTKAFTKNITKINLYPIRNEKLIRL